MDLREMHYLLEIANTGHMTQAANNLFISQPALSKSLRKVENELGTELFYRDGNRLLPTDQIPEELSSKSPLRFSNLRPI